MKTALIVPTFNPDPAQWTSWLECINAQTVRPDTLLIIDSTSTNGVVRQATNCGFTIHTIPKANFDHGATRALGIALLDGRAEVAIFLTQDALLSDKTAVEKLLKCFVDPNVAAVYGRQLPHINAHPIEAHARLYNYGSESMTKNLSTRAKLGFKTIFISNSFAAYRVSDLQAVGGFPQHTIFGEDTIAAAKLILAGKQIQYAADACVRHSHNYGFLQEFRRYFDIGVLHARERWLVHHFGGASSEGFSFVKSELSHLWRSAWYLIPSCIARTHLKYAGYRLGKLEHLLPLGLKRKLSMHRSFWK